MKNILLILGIGLLPCCAMAQQDTARKPDSAALQQDTSLAENGEAGGIDASETDTDKGSSTNGWLSLIVAAAGGAIIALIVSRVAGPKKKDHIPVAHPEVATPVTAEPKANTGEVKRLKQELNNLKLQLEALQSEKETLDKNLGIYRNFDSTYYNEAFRKLVAPVNEAMEKGSHKDLLEYLMKIMFHFSSLTRYKISKKQPYDEANIHYLLNQKGSSDANITEINGNTPLDKIPKNIKTIMDMLKEQDSKGLDDSVIAGYKLKDL